MLSDVLEATVDPEQWRLEVERVLPSLKMQHRHDNRVCLYITHTCMYMYQQHYCVSITLSTCSQDWRIHYQQMHQYHDGIKTILSDTKVSQMN